jgi:hypothetical protein
VHQTPRSSLAPADDAILGGASVRPAARRFAVELDRRGVFARLGRVEAYLCIEPDSAWSFLRESDGFDSQAWRLHLIVGRSPG